MANKEVRFTKISLKEIIDTLSLIYETGYDYVDILAIYDEEQVQDVIRIITKDEYYSENPNDDNDDDDDDSHKIQISLN